MNTSDKVSVSNFLFSQSLYKNNFSYACSINHFCNPLKENIAAPLRFLFQRLFAIVMPWAYRWFFKKANRVFDPNRELHKSRSIHLISKWKKGGTIPYSCLEVNSFALGHEESSKKSKKFSTVMLLSHLSTFNKSKDTFSPIKIRYFSKIFYYFLTVHQYF